MSNYSHPNYSYPNYSHPNYSHPNYAFIIRNKKRDSCFFSVRYQLLNTPFFPSKVFLAFKKWTKIVCPFFNIPFRLLKIVKNALVCIML